VDRVGVAVKLMPLSDEDAELLRGLIQNAMDEVDAAVEPEALIQPDTVESAMNLMAHYDWGAGFLHRLDLLFPVLS
jgi:hypothetical protein